MTSYDYMTKYLLKSCLVKPIEIFLSVTNGTLTFGLGMSNKGLTKIVKMMIYVGVGIAYHLPKLS